MPGQMKNIWICSKVSVVFTLRFGGGVDYSHWMSTRNVMCFPDFWFDEDHPGAECVCSRVRYDIKPEREDAESSPRVCELKCDSQVRPETCAAEREKAALGDIEGVGRTPSKEAEEPVVPADLEAVAVTSANRLKQCRRHALENGYATLLFKFPSFVV